MPNHRPSTPLGTGREFDAVRAMLARWGDVARGVGDDAAVLDVPAGERLVVSTDASVEGVHFRRGWLTPAEVGWRATTAALSDLAAMGARPLAVVWAAAVPPDWQADLPALADGVGDAVRDVGGHIVGGDLTAGTELSLTLTVLGSARAPVTRAGARPGDTLYVTGALGGPLRALRVWQRGAEPAPLDRERFARPRARVAAGRWLSAHGATALIDVSDGLAADLAHVAAASGVRCELHLAQVPCVAGATPLDALQSGEEYELLSAAPPDVDVLRCERDTGVRLTPIGRVTALDPGAEPEVVVRDAAGRRVDLPPGHDHFSRAC